MFETTARRIEWLVLLALWLVSIAAFSALPADAQMPIHINMHDEVDRWTAPAVGAFLLPTLATVLALLQWLLPHLDPRGDNLKRSLRALDTTMLVTIVCLAVVHAHLLAIAFGWSPPIRNLAPILVGVVSIFVGNVMGKVRPNFFMGIRTPWTLSNDEVWDKTHRFGGKVTVLSGVALLVLAFLPLSREVQLYAVIAAIAIASLLPVAMSYWLWRRLPQKPTKSPHSMP